MSSLLERKHNLCAKSNNIQIITKGTKMVLGSFRFSTFQLVQSNKMGTLNTIN